jgi:hypothetical protein
MVISHSYVSLPEGNDGLNDVLNAMFNAKNAQMRGSSSYIHMHMILYDFICTYDWIER